MGKSLVSLALLASSFLAFAPTIALAGSPMETWVGRHVDDRSIFISAVHLDGSDWSLRRNGSSLGDYKVVDRTDSYLELRAKGGTETIRLYGDRMEVSTGPGVRFVKIANGKWTE